MGSTDASKRGPEETDLLVPFEIVNIPAEYREYYRIKRNNFFASIQGFSEMWKYFLALDSLWLHEFDDLKPARDQNRMFPLLLYFNAHAKMRISIELALSGCMAEARSILRDAIEFVAHAHAMLRDPKLQEVWLSKNDEEEAFREAFERHKKEGVFAGLGELHDAWGQMSETGSHATLNAICDRFEQVESADGVEFRLRYCGVDHRMWAMSLFTMLLTCTTMERTMFGDYESRLRLDPQLVRMRAEVDICKEQLRKKLAIRYKVQRPKPESPIYKP